MNSTFPDAEVAQYEALVPALSLPDPDDRHILAAALRCQANVIVTANLKDFPPAYLATFDLERQHPDEFISNLIGLNQKQVLGAFQRQAACLKNPPKTAAEVLGSLRKSGLTTTAEQLAA